MEQSTMIRAGLENKLKEFNKNIKKAAYDNNVRILNECAFIIDLKKQAGNMEVFPLAVCFIVDKGYLKKIYNYGCDEIRNGDIGKYILLRTGEKEFYRGFKNRFNNTCSTETLGKQVNIEISEVSNIKNSYDEISKFLKHIYVYNNFVQYQEFGNILQDNEELYFNSCIDEYMKNEIINIEEYMKKRSYGDENGDIYLENRMKNIFNFSDTKFIHKIEMIDKFYVILKKKIDIEVEKEYIRVLIDYFNSIINYNIDEKCIKW